MGCGIYKSEIKRVLSIRLGKGKSGLSIKPPIYIKIHGTSLQILTCSYFSHLLRKIKPKV